MKKRYKILIPIICVCVMVIGITSVTYASSDYIIKSKGKIQVDGNNDASLDILLDTEDLTTIKNNVFTGKKQIKNAIDSYGNNNINLQELPTFTELATAIDNLTTIPTGTYYYVDGTQGDETTIERYKKVDEKYYSCDVNGVITNNTEVDVTSKTLIEYTSLDSESLSAGSIGYVDKTLILGNGADNAAYMEQNKSEIVENIIYSIYKNQASSYTFSGNACSSSANVSYGYLSDSDTFTYTKDFPIYKIPDTDENGALNTINFTISLVAAQTFANDGAYAGANYSVVLDNGTVIKSGSVALNGISYSPAQNKSEAVSINLFNFDVGDAKKLTINVSGNTSVRAENRNDTTPYATATLGTIELMYLPIGS